MDQIPPAALASFEASRTSMEEQKALALAMIKLIESCASAGREAALPPDATFHTYA